MSAVLRVWREKPWAQVLAASPERTSTLRVALSVASITTAFEVVKNLFDPQTPVLVFEILIVPIGDWVLRTACAQARKWQQEGLPAVPIAVNVSSVQFRQRGFLELVSRVLRETGLPPEYLELELTESLIQSNADVMPTTLKELKAIGVKLSIDDFGTGYSSFSYLRHFQVHKLKIDRSFKMSILIQIMLRLPAQ